jgi:hypothetical protein
LLEARQAGGASVRALSFWIGLFLFSVYLLSFSGKFHVMDELAVFTAGNNLAQHGRADINQLIWTNHWTPHAPGIWGQDGNLYTKKAPGISILTVPLLWLGHALPGLDPVQVGLLTNTVLTAFTASLLVIWLTDLGFSRRSAGLTALGYGLCTIAWVYARMFWELSILGLCYLIAVWAVRRATRPETQRRWPWLLLCGSIMAFGLTLRFETGVAVLLIGLYLFTELKTHPPTSQAQPETSPPHPIPDPPSQIPHPKPQTPNPKPLIIYLLPSLLAGLALAAFNFARYGSFGETGYTQEFLFLEPWVGGYGLLLSPGNGLFLYAPFMLLLFFGLGPAWRRLPRAYFWLIAAICVFYWIFYGSWFAWGGVWGWGPRFFLPMLPLLMVFVAEVLEWANSDWRLARLGMIVLALLSLSVNVLGIAVDFNEHFLRLGRNDNFTFNWAAFPPLGHWRILQEGLVDIIWLRPGPNGLTIEWSILAPALILLVLTTIGLFITINNLPSAPRSTNPKSQIPNPKSLISHPAPYIAIALLLTYLTMTATARVALRDEQTQLDLPVLATLDAEAHPGDALLIPMPPFGDAQELTTRLLAQLDRSLPVSTWIESEPRAILPEERDRVWQATRAEAERVWLFERWLTQNDPLGPTAAGLNQAAFLIEARWFEQSGRLSLYALNGDDSPTLTMAPDVPFQGGLELGEVMVFGHELAPGDVLKVRLTWQAPGVDQLQAAGLPAAGIVGFIHLVDEAAAQNVAQQDRLLLDLQQQDRAALRPGQTVPQGYGLRLPPDLAPGSYPLIVGLYVANTGQRLPRVDGSPDDFLYLTTITVRADHQSLANR